MIHLPESVHQALVDDTASAMARRSPAVAQAVAEVRAEENAKLMRLIDDPPIPTTHFDVFAPSSTPFDLHLQSTPRCRPNHLAEAENEKLFRQEYGCKFTVTDPEPNCPNCTEGILQMDPRGRGLLCRNCGHKTWERGPVYVDQINFMPMMRSPNHNEVIP